MFCMSLKHKCITLRRRKKVYQNNKMSYGTCTSMVLEAGMEQVEVQCLCPNRVSINFQIFHFAFSCTNNTT